MHSRAEDVAVEPGEGIDEDIVARSEVGIAIFGPDRPIVCDGVFEAAADGPADAGIREAVRAGEGRVEQGVGVGGRNAGVETAESDAARGVDEEAIEGVAEPAADRTLNAEVRADGGGNVILILIAERREVDGLAEARTVDVAFKTQHKLIDLVSVADVRAADHAIGVAVNRLKSE